MLFSGIFPGSNVSSMLDAIVMVAMSHNFPTREKQLSSFINNLCQVQIVFFSSGFSLGFFVCRFLSCWKGGNLVIQWGLVFCWPLIFCFLSSFGSIFSFIYTINLFLFA